MTDIRKYGGDAVQAIRTASLAQYHLSAMADRKASMMMGASFVVFTICVAQATTRGHLPPALLVLAVSALLAAVISAIAVMPTIHAAKDLQGQRNLMFFGGFADMKEVLLRRPGKGAITAMMWDDEERRVAFGGEAGDCGIIDISG